MRGIFRILDGLSDNETRRVRRRIAGVAAWQRSAYAGQAVPDARLEE
jgi:hypothetical protein